MKVSISWLKELVDLNCSLEELISLLPLRSISIKEVTDNSIELDMKGYNRADLLSMRGVAYEVAAVTDSKVLFEEPEEGDFVWNESKLPSTPVSIKEDILSEVQCAVKIEGLEYGQSPKDWVRKLEDSGIRPVNNIVDVTNLIMLEFGQPLHSFDAQDLEDETINVRRAEEGEELTTLDGKLRKLTSEDIVLADTQKALDVAGIMGSKDTEIKESTHTIILSSSIFNPQMVAKTASRLGLHSEASKRFQHGLTKKRLLQALNAAIKMYESLGGKVTAITLVGDFEDKNRKITLTKKKLEELVGVEFEDKQKEEYLQKLGFTLASQGVALRAWEIAVPYWRLDVNIEEDIIEEVARMYGYEKIPATKVSESKSLQKEDPIFQKISDLRQKLVELGLTEVQTYSFFSTDVIRNFDPDRDTLVKIANPISSGTEYLRDWLSPNLVEVVARNFRKGFFDQAIFEIGKACFKDKSQLEEKYYLATALMNGSDNPIQELYQIWHKLRLQLNKETGEKVGLPNQEEYHKLFHPTRFIAFTLNGKDIGGIAEIHPRIISNFGLEKRVAILEIAI